MLLHRARAAVRAGARVLPGGELNGRDDLPASSSSSSPTTSRAPSGWRDRRRFEKHLALCDACTRYIEQMRETLDLLGTVPVDSLSAEAQSTLLDAFRDLER